MKSMRQETKEIVSLIIFWVVLTFSISVGVGAGVLLLKGIDHEYPLCRKE